jgi:glyoxylase-like metal-dependent hydrolase (beta-lactamase superfamily II)
MAEMIEQTFVPLADGVQRLTLPLPTGPKHVHCYLVDGTLFDTGLGLGEAPWASVGVERIAITHFHPDHVGGAADAAQATGAPVYQGALDYAQCERVWGSEDWPERMAAWFIRHGHLGFLRDGVLIGGDHVLRRISPAIGLYPESRPDPLGDYLTSLERTIQLAPRIVYPGHGEPLEDAAGRAGELIEHHRRRLEATEAALSGEGRTAYEVSLTLFGRELGPIQRRFAVAETLSHLERLVREGRAARGGDGLVVSYTGT